MTTKQIAIAATGAALVVLGTVTDPAGFGNVLVVLGVAALGYVFLWPRIRTIWSEPGE